jgi:hypothetical protein
MRFLVERFQNTYVASPLELAARFITSGQGATAEEAIKDCQKGISDLHEEYGDRIFEYEDESERPLEVAVIEVE